MHSVCSSRRVESFVLWLLTVWPAKGLNYFTSAASIIRLCEAVKVQFSDTYKNIGKTKLLYNFKIVSSFLFQELYMFRPYTVPIIRSILVVKAYERWIVKCGVRV
jgi:hypothetical protein